MQGACDKGTELLWYSNSRCVPCLGAPFILTTITFFVLEMIVIVFGMILYGHSKQNTLNRSLPTLVMLWLNLLAQAPVKLLEVDVYPDVMAWLMPGRYLPWGCLEGIISREYISMLHTLSPYLTSLLCTLGVSGYYVIYKHTQSFQEIQNQVWYWQHKMQEKENDLATVAGIQTFARGNEEPKTISTGGGEVQTHFGRVSEALSYDDLQSHMISVIPPLSNPSIQVQVSECLCTHAALKEKTLRSRDATLLLNCIPTIASDRPEYNYFITLLPMLSIIYILYFSKVCIPMCVDSVPLRVSTVSTSRYTE